ncbi:ABC transporter ATP-binding protein [Paenibacillus selenitireducens]|uniref:ABC transporter ATP-binding protein n=1 Tax=Paenibacillus selenitireducens TaxID=1324314 RepID=A0A1T2X023_9BACL|nr:ABC transporter ATP-binding protein [Paenibacillus selenitireducens]OPA73230.1 ABC transporter ATP-binding protein [Paenibacillus selenitireducens]
MRDREDSIVLKVDQVKKRIGKKWIIHGVSFDVRAGEIFGFLGPNGSGKTTTIRMLVDLIKPTSGQIEVCGYNVNKDPEQALQHVGCIVENPEVYNYLTGWENLEHFARMQPHVDQTRIQEVVDIVRLDQRIHDKVKTYSLGMRQRLGIAQALLGRPKLLILDEPTNGLDPKGIKELRTFIRELADQGMALFVSSHLLTEIQLMCDRVAIISHGRVLAVGDVEDLIEEGSNYVVWQLEPAHKGRELLHAEKDVEIVNIADINIDEAMLAGIDQDAIITQMNSDRTSDLIRKMVASGVQVHTVQKMNPTLEQLFLRMTEGESIE